MTEANTGSVAALEQPAGTPAAANGTTDPGSTGGASDPFSGLETDTRSWVEKAGIKDVATLAAKARNAESLIGKSIQVPGDDAKPEDIDKFLDKATAKYRPKDAAGYEFKLPEGVPKEMPYDADFATAFKAEALKGGLTTRQAGLAHDFYVQTAAKSFAAQQAAEADLQTKATDALVAKWGQPDSDTFKRSSEMATRAIDGLGIGKALADSGIFVKTEKGLVVRNADLALALERVGSSMFKEDSLVGGTGGVTSDNPFKDGPDKGNQTVMMQAIKTDKAAAIRAIRAAGFKPEQWHITE